MVVFVTASATLPVIDAWFDVTTPRRGDLFRGILFAGLVEIPLALMLIRVALQVLRHGVRTAATTPPHPRSFDTVDGRDYSS